MIQSLVTVEPLGLPVPPAWLFGFKIFGFLLHMVFMNLWLAGLPAALCLLRLRPLAANRLFKAMPFFMAFGINAGIVPLLFLQTLYPQFFYPATILQAWFWFVVIPLLIVAYYAVYLAAFDRYRVAAAALASLLLAWIGLTFSSAMTLAASPAEWLAIFSATAEAGSIDGLFFYLSAESISRFLIMVGLSLGTLAAFFALDAEFFTVNERYRSEARPLVAPLYCLGFGVFGAVGMFYGVSVRDQLPLPLWALAAASVPAGAVTSLVYWKRPAKLTAGSVVGAHFLALLVNTLARQSVQSRSVEKFATLEALPVRGDWDSFLLFMVVLAIVLIVLAWLARLAYRASRNGASMRNP
jgi:hypothetical protein